GVGHKPDGVKEVATRAVGSEMPAVLKEGVAHLGARARLVCRQALDHHRATPRPVALVAHTLQAPEVTPAALGALARLHALAATQVSPLAVSRHARTHRGKNRRV